MKGGGGPEWGYERRRGGGDLMGGIERRRRGEGP